MKLHIELEQLVWRSVINKITQIRSIILLRADISELYEG